MYKLNKPIHIACIKENEYILSVPRLGIRVEINENVFQFIRYLQQKKIVDSKDVENYIKQERIENAQDYIGLFQQMLQINILIQA